MDGEGDLQGIVQEIEIWPNGIVDKGAIPIVWYWRP